jgi:hypothetical protein
MVTKEMCEECGEREARFVVRRWWKLFGIGEDPTSGLDGEDGGWHLCWVCAEERTGLDLAAEDEQENEEVGAG